jgi:hypothetical protein
MPSDAGRIAGRGPQIEGNYSRGHCWRTLTYRPAEHAFPEPAVRDGRMEG